ncbi:MAG: DUF2798 domain-containing protein [Formosimonas sp.]
MHKIHPKHTPLLTALFMSFFMGGLMAGVVTLINQGYSPMFFTQWASAFVRVWPIAFVLLFILRPLVSKIVAALVAQPK